MTAEALDRLVGEIERELLAFHEAEPKATGIATSALRDRVDRRLAPKVFDAVLEQAVARGVAVGREGPGHVTPRPRSLLSPRRRPPSRRCCRCSSASRSLPRASRELAAEAGVDPGVARQVLGRLANEGRIARRLVRAVLRELGAAPTRASGSSPTSRTIPAGPRPRT